MVALLRGVAPPPARDSLPARAIVESAGLTYIEGPYIADTVRRLAIHK